jgi:hypothetical protein
MHDQSSQPDNANCVAACTFCGSRDITTGLKLAQKSETGDVGIRFEATDRFLGSYLTGNEPLLVDLCRQCGTIVRFYVACTDRKWLPNQDRSFF